VHFAGLHDEVEAAQDEVLPGLGVEVPDLSIVVLSVRADGGAARRFPD
jgi:hypothetical protein